MSTPGEPIDSIEDFCLSATESSDAPRLSVLGRRRRHSLEQELPADWLGPPWRPVRIQLQVSTVVEHANAARLIVLVGPKQIIATSERTITQASQQRRFGHGQQVSKLDQQEEIDDRGAR